MFDNAMDILSETFLRFLETKGVITCKQLSTIKAHKSRNRQLAILKNVVSQKDAVGFHAFCHVMLDYIPRDHGEILEGGIEVPGMASSGSSGIIEHDSRSERGVTSRRSSSALPPIISDRRTRARTALAPRSASDRAPQPHVFVVKGISYEWHQVNHTEHLHAENTRLLGLIREELAELRKELREKNCLVLELEHQSRDRELLVQSLKRDLVEAQAKIHDLSPREAAEISQVEDQASLSSDIQESADIDLDSNKSAMESADLVEDPNSTDVVCDTLDSGVDASSLPEDQTNPSHQ